MSDVQVYSIYIEAPAEKVWEAITSPEWSNKFGYGGDIEVELSPGGAFRSFASPEMKQMGLPDVVITGEVVEASAPTKLVLRWDPVWHEDPPTTLTYELVDHGGSLTRLILTHDVTAAPHTAAEVAGGGDPGQGGGGWPWVLASFKTVLETGRPMVGAGA